MTVDFNYTNEEKDKIRDWKTSLPINPSRMFKYVLIENGKKDNEGYKLYDYYITSNLDETKKICENISL
jgi:hypothetical protein